MNQSIDQQGFYSTYYKAWTEVLNNIK